jgi:GntR family transcriptional repressor for pyruvate dehydrogenase complex
MGHRIAAEGVGKVTRTDAVVEEIRKMVLDGRLRAGDRLPVEADLAAQLGISRGSLREGVRALISMGVLEARQGSGTFVTDLDLRRLFAPMAFIADLDLHDALDFLAVRRVLECEAAATAALRITPEQLHEAELTITAAEQILNASEGGTEQLSALLELDRDFHRIVARSSGNSVCVALLDVLAGQTWRMRRWRLEVEPESGMVGIREHRAILAAMRAHDPDRARAQMQVHLFGVEDFVQDPARSA